VDHVAIMKKSWGLTEKILTGQKNIESRWYLSKRAPWGIVKPGDKVYFKNSGEPVKIVADVDRVLQFANLSPQKVREILREYGEMDGIAPEDSEKFFGLFKDKRYCMLVFLKDAKQVEPFDIDKRGFGMMSAWVTLDDVRKIKK
jgi:ASC-1-like (ASCH) protein